MVGHHPAVLQPGGGAPQRDHRGVSQWHTEQPDAVCQPGGRGAEGVLDGVRDDYDTPDGTGVWDYIHVMDLGRGHLFAIEYMEKKGGGLWNFNLGTGTGYSVLDIVKAMEKACVNEIKYKLGPQRGGGDRHILCRLILSEKGDGVGGKVRA